MKKTLISAIIFLLFGYVLSYAEIPGRVTVSGTQFQVCGNRIWLSGCNTPWDNWNDFGGSYDSAFWGQHFADLHAAGVNASRIWITCSGEVGINISTAGVVTGGTAAHWANLDDMFAKAQANGIYIMATLISFDHFKSTYTTYDRWRNWIASDSNIDTYINTYLDTFLTRYASNPALWSIDLCNEPEWASATENTSDPATNGGIAWTRLQTYFAKAAVKIHKYNQANGTGVLVTTGMGYIKYNSDTRGLGGSNVVSDSALAALITTTADKPLAKMDFWSPHYYPWQNQWGWIPFEYTPSAFGLPNDRPAVVGECPNKYGSTNGATPTPGQIAGQLKTDYSNAYNNGWQGVFPWTSNGAGSGDFGNLDNELRPAAQQMQTMIPTLVALPVCSTPTYTWTPGGPTATFTHTGTNTHTSTATPTPMPYTIIYDGDTTGARISNGTIYNDTTSTMTEQTGGVTGNAMSVVYTADTDYWQEARWDIAANPVIGGNIYLTFEIKLVSGNAGDVRIRVNWADVYPLISDYLTTGTSIDTTWRTARVPLADIIEAGQTALDFILFINNSNNAASVLIDNIRLESTGGATSTPTDTSTHTATSTYTKTNTPIVPTNTNTNTNTNTHTATNTATVPVSTNTYTATHTAPRTFTHTNTYTATDTATVPTSTNTHTATVTDTVIPGSTDTNTYTATFTHTNTNTYTATHTATNTATNTYTNTDTYTATNTATVPTSTNTHTATVTDTVISGSTNTNTYTATYTHTNTNTYTATSSATNTSTHTATVPTSTSTHTATVPTNTSTHTATVPTNTSTHTATPSATNTHTRTYTNTATRTHTPTRTNTPVPPTLTFTNTYTNTHTPTQTHSYTPTPTATSLPADADEQKIKDVFVFPHPYNSDGGNMRVRYRITKRASEINLKIYSSSFRLIKEIQIGADLYAGEHTAEVSRRKMNLLANGSYYFVIRDDTGASSKLQKLIILK